MKIRGCLLVLLMGFATPALAYTFNVNSTDDQIDNNPGDRRCWTGDLVAGGAAECTLRAAIMESNHWRSGRIVLPAGVFRLTLNIVTPDVEERQQLRGFWDVLTAMRTGDLDIKTNLWIEGAGMGMTVIDGDGRDRVFDMWGGLAIDFTLQNLTVRNGSHPRIGGCIFNRQPDAGLWIFSSSVEGCSAPGSVGGGVYNSGDLIIRRGVFRHNSAGRGGAIENGQLAQIDESTFESNRSEALGTEISSGGAISNINVQGGWVSLQVTNSTLALNRTAGTGSAISNKGSASIRNSTISGNTAVMGGALALAEEPLPTTPSRVEMRVISSTVVNNSGGGTWRTDSALALHVFQSILAGNTSLSGAPSNCHGFVTDSLESLEDSDTCGLAGDGDMVMTDPMIGPLADNGGPTRTHALLAGSLALDVIHGSTDRRDQRDFPRPMFGGADIGAYEKGFDLTLLIPLDWTMLFEDIFTMSDTSFRLTLSVKTAGKDDEFTDARITGVKGANGPVKVDVATDGTSLDVSGVFTPPKDQSNSTLLYVEVQRGVDKPALLQIDNVSCDCDAKPRKNPPSIVIPKAGKKEP